jgi:hypothetical protein
MVVQDTKFAWADDELPSRRDERERERQQQRGGNAPVPTAETLRELEPPVAAAKIGQQPPAEAFVEGSSAFVDPDHHRSATQEPSADAESAEPKWWSAATAGEPTRKAAAAAKQAAAAAAAQAAAAAAAAAATPAEPVFTDDPFRQYTAAPSFGSLFDTSAPVTVTSANGESLESIFGTPQTRRSAMGRTPIVTPTLAEDQQPQATGAKITTSTGPAWIIALVPLFQLVVGLLVVTSLGMAVNQWMLLAIFILPYFAVIGLAYLDYSALKRGGVKKPAHWAFAFASVPVYLILRARATLRETGHGIGPVLVFVGLVVLLFASVIAVPGLIIAAAPAAFSAQIEQSVHSQALIIGSDLVVDCPATPPVLPGEEVVCTTTNGDIKSTATVEMIRANGWIAYNTTDWGKFQR